MTPVPQFAPPLAAPAVPDPYPDSDGLSMAENTLQFDWIVKIKENLEIRFADDPEVFVAGDLLWYPVPDGGQTRPLAPDTLVAFGRPKGRRGSYKQWEEGGIPPQVVFEILSPSNTPKELRAKREFYDRHGVEEYYVYDPDRNRLEIWRRGAAGVLERLSPVKGWISPRLGIRFALGRKTLELFHPDGTPFRSPVELARLAEEERRQAALERLRATEADRQAALERQRAERLAARLRALGIDPEASD